MIRFAFFALAALFSAASAQTKPGKDVAVYLEGDTSTIPKLITVCRDMGPQRGLHFRFVDTARNSTTIA
jgi:hypothetical protein